MYSQLLQAEDRFHQMQRELTQELHHIEQVKQALNHPGRTSILHRMQVAAGIRLVTIGTWLVERNNFNLHEEQKGHKRAAGLA